MLLCHNNYWAARKTFAFLKALIHDSRPWYSLRRSSNKLHRTAGLSVGYPASASAACFTALLTQLASYAASAYAASASRSFCFTHFCFFAASALWAASASAAATVGGFVPSQSPGANNVLVYNASAVLGAGTVPLARMMRTEVQGYNAAD